MQTLSLRPNAETAVPRLPQSTIIACSCGRGRDARSNRKPHYSRGATQQCQNSEDKAPAASMKVPPLDLKTQYANLQAEIQAAVSRVLASGQFILGPEVAQFETEVAAYLGVRHAIGVNSGTDALVVGLRALGVGPGDEVITTPFSFFATAEAISMVGATPVFADVEIGTFNLDPKEVARKIAPRTKAIVPVHLFGRPAAMAQILELARAHGLPVLEDAAQSFGARYDGQCEGCWGDRCSPTLRAELTGRFTGTLGNLAAFSFFPTKNLGAYGDGGLIATDDDRLAEMARMLRVHGSKGRYQNELLGYNSRLDALQAAILRVKLPYVAAWNQRRRQIARTYNALLADLPGLIVPEVCAGHVFHQYTLRATDGRRDALRAALAAADIGAMVYYPIPQDRLPVYAGRYERNPASDTLSAEVLSLPIWPEMSDETIAFVAQEVRACWHSA